MADTFRAIGRAALSCGTAVVAPLRFIAQAIVLVLATIIEAAFVILATLFALSPIAVGFAAVGAGLVLAALCVYGLVTGSL